jgi:hypothetical protein
MEFYSRVGEYGEVDMMIYGTAAGNDAAYIGYDSVAATFDPEVDVARHTQMGLGIILGYTLPLENETAETVLTELGYYLGCLCGHFLVRVLYDQHRLVPFEYE